MHSPVTCPPNRGKATWDAENRLRAVESLTNAPAGAKVKVAWTYDARSRRIQQQSYTEQFGTLVLTNNLKFLADGWRHIAELDATNNTPLKTYAWGLDLSGSLDGAGGVGGLLFFSDLSPITYSPSPAVHFTAYDGNGNVRALFSAGDGTLTAQYDYDAFGNILRATGSAALANSFRFSTKRTDDLTSLVLYEYRGYLPWLGRWVSRDPIEENGGLNLNAIVHNSPVGFVDALGQLTYTEYMYDALKQLEGKKCCEVPCRYSLDAGHSSTHYLITSPDGFSADGKARITSSSGDCDSSLKLESWWSCCKNGGRLAPVGGGPLPQRGMSFECPCAAGVLGNANCRWVVRVHFLSCERGRMVLRHTDISGNYNANFYTKELFFQGGSGGVLNVSP